jgi:hypothetical protein
MAGKGDGMAGIMRRLVQRRGARETHHEQNGHAQGKGG